MVSNKEIGKEKKDIEISPRGNGWERVFTVEEHRVNECFALFTQVSIFIRNILQLN